MVDRYAWTEEGAHPVAPGVHRIPLPLPSDGLRAVNVYAVESDSGLVLIDSGWALANALGQLKRSLAAIGAGLPDVRQFLVTHMHRDHYTQAVEVRRLFGTPISLGEGEKPSIDGLLSADFRPLRAQLAILRAAGAAPVADRLAELTSGSPGAQKPAAGAGSGAQGAETQGAGIRGSETQGSETQGSGIQGSGIQGSGIQGFGPLPPAGAALRRGTTVGAALGYEAPDEWICGQQVFDIGSRTLMAVETPGHTRGHVVFADTEAGLLFAGDHVLPHITPSIGFQEAPSPEPLREYLQSLSVVRQLPDMRLLPAHGPVSPSTHARIDELTEHHAQRLRIMADVLSGGERTGYDVALSVAWTSRQRKLGELDLMNQMLAVCETVYHLDLLVAQGTAVSQVGEDRIRRYRLPMPPATPAASRAG